MRMVNIIAEFNIINFSCVVSVKVIFTDQLINVLRWHQLHLLKDSRELLNSDMLNVSRIEVLKARLKKDSVSLDNLLDVQ